MCRRVSEPPIRGSSCRKAKGFCVVTALDADFHPPARVGRHLFREIEKAHVGSEFVDSLTHGAAAPQMVLRKIEVQQVGEVCISAQMPSDDFSTGGGSLTGV